MTRRRIAIAGFQHETNTYAPFRAGFAEFEMADSWPGLLTGDAVIENTRGMNLPIAGAVTEAAVIGDIEPIPILWCSAEPSGHVTDAAFRRIGDMILDGLATGPLDGIYLDLHGAMVTESHASGEAALLARIRDQVGPDMPIGISLDLHANIAPDVVHHADVIAIYRTYPHLDMAETGARAMRELVAHMSGLSRAVAFRQIPFPVPLNAQYTGANPCKRFYALLDALPIDGKEYVDIAMGFTASDAPDCGPSVVAYAANSTRAAELANQVAQNICAAEQEFDTYLFEPDEAVQRAKAIPGTVILADVQDNPGAGGSADTTGLLLALVDARAVKALLGVIFDPEVAAQAHDTGIGGRFSARLGGKIGHLDIPPFEGSFQVRALSDGVIPFSGAMYGGGVAKIGPSCLLSVEGRGCDVKVVVSSVRAQCLDQALFTHFGVDPSEAKIVCVKSTVHFRADFEGISSAVLNVAAPGLFPCSLSDKIDKSSSAN
ncbi:MAG: M81 family metallopeptidase [Pseudomonadota bacterium]